MRKLLSGYFLVFRKIVQSGETSGKIFYSSSSQNDHIFRHFDPKEAIELDRFVYRLEGNTRELITRHSGQVASTMKQEHGMTVNRSVKREAGGG